ncbi:TerC family protein [Azospirillum sp. YIM DDC1]|jgi:Membrane protein TerC, possibly involved in tellurium resistance|uniref:TerC family protein n=1 Tax=Azospirillum aestuarii TaxID=2802052 RepID=A0ABS1HVA3_9PROT|nr:TerC family protein [Azospirillum aestuarii]MBK4718750.1 TerC family protein [Azospirillum aestuarii]TWA95374.1 putative tellurium resistance membrane protein TerC [Azospirillum brasilense]
MLELLSDPQVWASLLTLTALEIVLGIDNIIFISIMAAKLPVHQQQKARQLGLALALVMRLLLLASISWVATLTEPLITVLGMGFSGRDLILLGGGLFLLAKGTIEIHNTVEGHEEGGAAPKVASFGAVVGQIIVLDIVFSLDSVITAVGMSNDLPVMVTAVVIAMAVMLFAARPVGDFVNRHVTVKMLALSFLLLVGVALIADGFGFHIPKGYLYFAIAFSTLVEALNLMAAARRKRKKAEAH